VSRIASGGKLFVDGESTAGVLLGQIVDLIEAVKLVDAKDVHYLSTVVERNMRDMDENDHLT